MRFRGYDTLRLSAMLVQVPSTEVLLDEIGLTYSDMQVQFLFVAWKNYERSFNEMLIFYQHSSYV